MTRADDPHSAIHWESHSAAIRAYKISTDKTASDIALQFAIIAKDTFRKAIKAAGWDTFTRKLGASPNVLVDAVLAGTNNRSGNPEEFFVRVFYVLSNGTVESEVVNIPPSAVNVYNFFATGSDTSVVAEFGSTRTFRANIERKQWDQTMVGKSFDEKLSLFAVQLAKWEIAYTKKPDIGGAVDYMVLSRAGIADHRKPACRDNKN